MECVAQTFVLLHVVEARLVRGVAIDPDQLVGSGDKHGPLIHVSVLF